MKVTHLKCELLAAINPILQRAKENPLDPLLPKKITILFLQHHAMGVIDDSQPVEVEVTF